MNKLNQESFTSLIEKLNTEDIDTINVGMSTCGVAAGAKEVFDFLSNEVKNRNLPYTVKPCGCVGMCYAEPLVEIRIKDKKPALYGNIDKKAALRIIETHIGQDHLLKEHLLEISEKQTRIVLRNCGIINPRSIDEYIATNGYQALKKVIFESSPEGVIEELKESGLRGRGGAGFPTWLKWSFSNKSEGKEKFVICNGDEGDPGAYMDRSILEGDPHAIIEGMAIAAYATKANQGFVYIRAEYPLAIERIQGAIDQAKEYGFIGKNILGSDFSLNLEIRLGAGAFVCGEETALIASIEGKRGTPSPRPPFPSISGLWKAPTTINNVETLANIAQIILKGGKWFSSIGTEKSKGTKVFALTGKVKNAGLVEIPMGTPLKDIVFDIGGAGQDGKKVLAIQTGGPSGGVIPEQYFNTPVSYEHLSELGSIMGSGGMIVIDEDNCIIDLAKFYLGFCVDESCGKCAPCKIGGMQMLKIFNRICEGKGEEKDIQRLERISHAMQKASLCGLGQTAPNPVISTLKYFKNEYLEHINDKKCRAKVCKDLLSYDIIQEKCKRCGLCFKHCPVGAITGDRKNGYFLNQEKCINCGKCFEVCKFDSISRG